MFSALTKCGRPIGTFVAINIRTEPVQSSSDSSSHCFTKILILHKGSLKVQPSLSECIIVNQSGCFSLSLYDLKLIKSNWFSVNSIQLHAQHGQLMGSNIKCIKKLH